MKKTVVGFMIGFLVAGFFLAGCVPSSSAPKTQTTKKTQPDLRALQTRTYDAEDKTAVMTAVLSVLQDDRVCG